MKTLLMISLSCLFLVSCAEKGDDNTNNPGSTSTEESLTGTLHDTTFKADYFSGSYPQPLLSLYAYETTTNRSISLTLDNKDVGTHTMTLDLNGTSASCQGGGSAGYYSIHGAGHGSIIISASSSTKVSGTFSFTGYTLDGSDSAVVSGQFSNFSF